MTNIREYTEKNYFFQLVHLFNETYVLGNVPHISLIPGLILSLGLFKISCVRFVSAWNFSGLSNFFAFPINKPVVKLAMINCP